MRGVGRGIRRDRRRALAVGKMNIFDLFYWILHIYDISRRKRSNESTPSAPDATRVPRRDRVRPLDLITDIVIGPKDRIGTISKWRKKLTTGSVGSQIRARGDLTYGAHLFIGIVTFVWLSIMLLENIRFVRPGTLYELTIVFGLLLFIPLIIAVFLAIVLGTTYSVITPKDWRLGVLSMTLVLFLTAAFLERWVGVDVIIYLGVAYVMLCFLSSGRWFLFVRKGLVPDEPLEEPEVPIGELPTI